MSRRVLYGFMLYGSVAIAGEGVPGEAARLCGDDTLSCADERNHNWVDNSYDYVTYRADSLAVWLDSFFGKPSSDFDSADSLLRLRLEHKWDENRGSKDKIRLRGKVDLPRIDERLSLVFSEEDEDRNEVVPGSAGEDDDVGLQYRIRDHDHSRLYVSVGTNSSLDFKSSIRYKYTRSLSDSWRTQLSERIYYKSNDGFGVLTRGDIDYSLDQDRIIRWTNQFDYGEQTHGVEWGTKLNYEMRIDEKSAVGYFGTVSGVTDPSWLTRSYGVGLRYRRSFFRPWMFFELEPMQAWRRETLEDSRESVWIVTLRVELLEEISNRWAAN